MLSSDATLDTEIKYRLSRASSAFKRASTTLERPWHPTANQNQCILCFSHELSTVWLRIMDHVPMMPHQMSGPFSPQMPPPDTGHQMAGQNPEHWSTTVSTDVVTEEPHFSPFQLSTWVLWASWRFCPLFCGVDFQFGFLFCRWNWKDLSISRRFFRSPTTGVSESSGRRKSELVAETTGRRRIRRISAEEGQCQQTRRVDPDVWGPRQQQLEFEVCGRRTFQRIGNYAEDVVEQTCSKRQLDIRGRWQHCQGA